MRRILLTSTARQPFVLDDAESLRRHFDVRILIGSGPFTAVRMLLGAARADCSVVWFASVYSFAVTLGARLFGKRSIVVVGGVDAAAIPSLGYGIWLSRWKSALVRRALAGADRILAVDESLVHSLRSLSGLPLEHARVLSTGYDPGFWSPSSDPNSTVGRAEGTPERGGVLCVATCDSVRRATVKGLDLLLEAAELLPEIPFTVIGVKPAFVRGLPFHVPGNVQLLPAIPREELRSHYRSAAVYCQPSRHEGLPNALCEAMLCGAVPVGTDVGGMRRAIGECGVVVQSGSARELEEGIRRAFEMSAEAGAAARERIAELYSRQRRERGLVAAVESLLREGAGEA